jgi:hypothetical protein
MGNPRLGTPRGKIRFRLNPVRFNDAKPSLNAAVSSMLKDSRSGGVSDRPFEHLFFEHNLGGQPKMTAIQEMAMALMLAFAVAMVRGIKMLQGRGFDLNTVTEVELCDRIGLFNARDHQIRDDLVNGWFLDIGVNRAQSRANLDRLRRDLPGAFSNGRLVKKSTTDARYAQLAVNLGNIAMVAALRAHHVQNRNVIGVAHSFAKGGQQVDVMLAHFCGHYC